MTVDVIIPARGGSKGVPRKNLVSVGGVPLVARSIIAARAARGVRHVYVSTDDGAIGAVARTFGAHVLERPAELASDTASSESVLLHALAGFTESLPEITIMMQCTSPFTRAEDVEGAIAAVGAGADVAFTARPFHGFLWQQGDRGFRAVNHDASSRPRRQDRQREWLENGALYAMRTAEFQRARHRFFGTVSIVPMPLERSLEIDDVEDLRAAHLALAQRRGRPAESLRSRRALVLDFDGVFTDNTVITSAGGDEQVACSRADGFGVEALRRSGFPMCVVSRERHPVTEARCRKLEIECFSGVDDKLTLMRSWLEKRSLGAGDVVYVGNDTNDLECIVASGCGVAVADAGADIIEAATLVLTRPGGRGAVRELCDLLRQHAAPGGE